jgi:putative copper export protein/methionine-rich copper-binding protein CopC
MKSIQNASRASMQGKQSMRRQAARVAMASALALFLLLLLSGVASAHALLARSDPAAGAILDADKAPTQLRLWFTEEVNPALTKAIVVDHNNKEVDLQNSHVSSSDPRELDTGLHQLSPGFYVVIWKSVSAEDGHATAGNFLFRIRFPDGTVPNLPSELPTGPANFANSESGQCLTGSVPLLCVPQVLSDWLVFLAAVVWVGGMFWQFLIVERAAQREHFLVSTALATARRFQRVAVIALAVFLLANIGYVIGQAMLAGGDWGSGFSPAILSGYLLHSSFGVFWLLRELFALLALLWLIVRPEPAAAEESWQPRRAQNGLRMVLGLLLLLAMAFSGHAAAAQARGGLGSFAVPVDWLHLLSTSLWVGGIIFIALTLMPALWGYESPDHARALVTLLPRFSVIALVGVTVAALTGSFNADVQLTSWNQFIDTTYGRTLIVKILLVVVMMLISVHHAFRLRPRLSKALAAWNRLQGADTETDQSAQTAGQDAQSAAHFLGIKAAQQANQRASDRRSGAARSIPLRPFTLPSLSAVNAPQQDETLEAADLTAEDEEALQAGQPSGHEQPAQKSARVLARVERLSEELRLWIRREALLGVGVLLCASLLGGFAGSLAPTPPGAPNINAPALTVNTKTPVDMTQTVNGLKVTLKVAPDKFGTNSVGVLLVDAKTGKPIDGANIHLILSMVEMDMGTSTSDLKGSGNGFYTGQIDLLMGGHWTIQVQIRTPQDPNHIQRATFTFPVTF